MNHTKKFCVFLFSLIFIVSMLNAEGENKMKTSHTLLLASGSASRKMLLEQMQIPFQVIAQSADESACDWGLRFQQLLISIAIAKMDHAQLPQGAEGDEIFVLTADSMCQDKQGVIHGKPIDKADAIAKIKALRQGGVVGSAFCLDRKKFENNEWTIKARIAKYVETSYVFDMPDEWIERYFELFPDYLHVAGGVSVEGYGQQFLKSINGSYTCLIGLPLFELRQSLQEIGFFKA